VGDYSPLLYRLTYTPCERPAFLIHIPIHKGCEKTLLLNGTQSGTQDAPQIGDNVPLIELTERQRVVLEMLQNVAQNVAVNTKYPSSFLPFIYSVYNSHPTSA